jgi:hypothetical protein
MLSISFLPFTIIIRAFFYLRVPVAAFVFASCVYHALQCCVLHRKIQKEKLLKQPNGEPINSLVVSDCGEILQSDWS